MSITFSYHLLNQTGHLDHASELNLEHIRMNAQTNEDAIRTAEPTLRTARARPTARTQPKLQDSGNLVELAIQG